jgi:hypothetical protein
VREHFDAAYGKKLEYKSDISEDKDEDLGSKTRDRD